MPYLYPPPPEPFHPPPALDREVRLWFLWAVTLGVAAGAARLVAAATSG